MKCTCGAKTTQADRHGLDCPIRRALGLSDTLRPKYRVTDHEAAAGRLRAGLQAARDANAYQGWYGFVDPLDVEAVLLAHEDLLALVRDVAAMPHGGLSGRPGNRLRSRARALVGPRVS